VSRAGTPLPSATASCGCLDGVFFRDAGDGRWAHVLAIGESARVSDAGAHALGDLFADRKCRDLAVAVAVRHNGSRGRHCRGDDGSGRRHYRADDTEPLTRS
jgi:hypothetical protein